MGHAATVLQHDASTCVLCRCPRETGQTSGLNISTGYAVNLCGAPKDRCRPPQNFVQFFGSTSHPYSSSLISRGLKSNRRADTQADHHLSIAAFSPFDISGHTARRTSCLHSSGADSYFRPNATCQRPAANPCHRSKAPPPRPPNLVCLSVRPANRPRLARPHPLAHHRSTSQLPTNRPSTKLATYLENRPLQQRLPDLAPGL